MGGWAPAVPIGWWSFAFGEVGYGDFLRSLSARAHYAADELPGSYWYSRDIEMCPRTCRCCQAWDRTRQIKASCKLCAEVMRVRSVEYAHLPLEVIAPIINTLAGTGCRQAFHCPRALFRVRIPLPRPAAMPQAELLRRRPTAAKPASRRRRRWAAGTLRRVSSSSNY